MQRSQIDVNQLTIKPHDLWNNRWLILTSGDFEAQDFNCLTVGWGSVGTIWGKPFVQVFVRPQRHTFHFLEKYLNFTLCAFPANHRSDLIYLGTKSGRDEDKIKNSGITPIKSTQISSPAYEEAELIMECKTIFWDDLEPTNFSETSIHSHYKSNDYHRIYFGEIMAIFGTDDYVP